MPELWPHHEHHTRAPAGSEPALGANSLTVFPWQCSIPDSDAKYSVPACSYPGLQLCTPHSMAKKHCKRSHTCWLYGQPLHALHGC